MESILRGNGIYSIGQAAAFRKNIITAGAAYWRKRNSSLEKVRQIKEEKL